MAKNKVEFHIPHTAFFTFKVAAGQTLVAGDLVVISGDRAVSKAGAGAQVVGVVYAGTVGKSSYVGNDNDVVTVVVQRPFVYLTPGANVAAGALLEAAANSKVITKTTGVAFAQAVTAGVLDGKIIAMLL